MATNPRRCQLILQQCLAITIRKGTVAPVQNDADFWMYDNGYLLYQSFISSNCRCWWNTGLIAACQKLRYMGYVHNGVMIVGSHEVCALELIRVEYARGLLKPPDGYVIVSLADMDECLITPVAPSQFTPLKEAICDVILEVTRAGQDAALESIRKSLRERFPNIGVPTHEVIYDTLAELVAEHKIYYKINSYYILTPETHIHTRYNAATSTIASSILSSNGSTNDRPCDDMSVTYSTDDIDARRRMLLTQDELLVLAHGDMATLRAGHITHQCVQTSLRDVICGGSPSDKIMYPRATKRRSTSIPLTSRNGTSPDRRRSTSTGRGGVASGGGGTLRMWASNRRLRRSASTRSLTRDKSATIGAGTDSSSANDSASPKRASLLSRIFRRSNRKISPPMGGFAALTTTGQYPPTEWFNCTVSNQQSSATQTDPSDMRQAEQLYRGVESRSVELRTIESRSIESREPRGTSSSSTLPRHHSKRDSQRLSSSSDKAKSSGKRSPLLLRNYNVDSLPRTYTPSQKSAKSERSTDAKSMRHSIEYRSTRETNRLHRHAVENRSFRETQCRTGKDATTTAEDNARVPLKARGSSTSETSGPSSLESHITPTSGSIRSSSGPSSLESTATNLTVKSPLSDARVKTNERRYGRYLDSYRTTNGVNSSTKTIKSTNERIDELKALTNDSKASDSTLKTDGKSSECNANEISENRLNHKVESTKDYSNSFTLKVTTTDCSTKNTSDVHITNGWSNNGNTKIYMQNSPVRSVITLENVGSVTSGSNDLQILNNDVKNNNNDGKVINTRQSTINNLKNNFFSHPGSPTKDNAYTRPTLTYLDKCFDKRFSFDRANLTKLTNSDKVLRRTEGSEPNLTENGTCVPSKGFRGEEERVNFPSLSDLQFNFTSLAAQKILHGVSINSVDTLVELNLIAEKENGIASAVL